MKIDIRYAITKDKLKLLGIHYDSGKRDICVLLIHGMSGNFLENYFGDVLGQVLAQNGVGYIYSHNRGYNFINDIATTQKSASGGYETQRHGAAFERFEESVFDVAAWVNEVKKLGYKKIILMGHSLGCNKIVHYLHKTNYPKNIIGVILGSPPDMVGAAKRDCGPEEYTKLTAQAKKRVAQGNPRKIWEKFVFGDWTLISAQTYLDISVDNAPGDIFPVIRNPKEFTELASVKLPILCFIGEKDGILINKSLDQYFSVLESKATSCPKFTKAVVKNANHMYNFQENQMAEIVRKWVSGLEG